MPQYSMLNKLPDLSFIPKMGKQLRLCADCLSRRYTNEPPRIGSTSLGKCEHCEDVKTCSTYEKRRLNPVPVKHRPKPQPTTAERFNIIRVPAKRKR